ncbi:MAG TPA: hypothetical protein VHR84_16825 [Terriglobales bacterium]|jgi:hypothetical protein|nr:hypothetical protein [Terriglobales bacterium]
MTPRKTATLSVIAFTIAWIVYYWGFPVIMWLQSFLLFSALLFLIVYRAKQMTFPRGFWILAAVSIVWVGMVARTFFPIWLPR